VGDIMLDHYVRGSIERTSPEAPVGVLSVESEEYILGGAANVARNLTSMGAAVELAGVVGTDGSRKLLTSLLRRERIGQTSLLVDKARPTTLKTRALAQGQQVLRIDRERKHPLSPEMEESLLKAIRSQLSRVDGVVVSDYGKGVLTPRVIQALSALCRKAGKPIVCDPKGLEYRRYRGFDVLTPNLKEAQAASGVEIVDEASLERAAAELIRQVDSKGICVTRGASGVTVFPRRGKSQEIPPYPREVYDVTGAGDTFIAHLALGFFQGLKLAEAAAWANLAAGIVVERLGVAVVTPRELISEVYGDRRAAKYVAVADLVPVVRTLQTSGQKVVFTNGCFDLLHLGHIRLLESARALGDCLIVALNSDASVRKVKGPPRPLLPEAERVALLAALDCVDYLVVFDESSPEKLIRLLRPDLLVKGGNLDSNEVVGKEIVEGYGGEVRLIPAFGDRSISQFLDRLESPMPKKSRRPKRPASHKHKRAARKPDSPRKDRSS